jgi:hypothetical protein
VGRRPASSSSFWGWKPSSSSAEEVSSSHAGEGELLLPIQGATFRPLSGRRWPAAPGGSHNTSYAMRAVLVFWDGPILVFVARTRVRTCRCALGRAALTGAVLEGRWTPPSVLRWWQLEKASPPVRPSAPSRTDLRLFGFNIWFSSPARGHKREPFSGSVRPGTVAAAVEVTGESPGVCRPAGSPMWRLFIPAGAEPEFRL